MIKTSVMSRHGRRAAIGSERDGESIAAAAGAWNPSGPLTGRAAGGGSGTATGGIGPMAAGIPVGTNGALAGCGRAIAGAGAFGDCGKLASSIF
jgi:hypothetical protein